MLIYKPSRMVNAQGTGSPAQIDITSFFKNNEFSTHNVSYFLSKSSKLKKHVYATRLLDSKADLKQVENELEKYRESQLSSMCTDLESLKYGVKPQLFLIRDFNQKHEFDQAVEQNMPVAYHVDLPAFVKKLETVSIQPATFKDVSAAVFKLRGYTNKPKKPLNLAGSFLEHKLYSSGLPWAGDLDALLYKDGKAVCILEFKTHKLNSSLEDYTAEKYYGSAQQPGPDRFRWNSLKIVAQNFNVPIVTVNWNVKNLDYVAYILEGSPVEKIFDYCPDMSINTLFEGNFEKNKNLSNKIFNLLEKNSFQNIKMQIGHSVKEPHFEGRSYG